MDPVDLQRAVGNRAFSAAVRRAPGREAPAVQRDKGYSARFAGEPTIAAVVAGTTTLASGASGPAVARLQRALVDLRRLPMAAVTGTFDATTRTAVLAFQKAQGIAETGKLDVDTMKRLDAAFDTRKPYVDMAKHDPAAPGTHALSAAERAAAVGAMVAAPVPGAPLVFKNDLGPPKGTYGKRIRKRLDALVKALHKSLFEDKKPLRADPAKNFHSWARLEAPALEAQKVVDAMFASQYGGPGAKPPLTHAGGNLIDQWEDEVAINAAKTAPKKKKKAADKAWYLINANCADINAEHSAVPSRATEKGILKPIVAQLVNTKAKVQKMLDLDIGWEGAQLDGIVYLQRFKSTDPDAAAAKEANRVQMWELFHTCIHEYLHTLAHGDFNAYAESFRAAGDETRYNTLTEGFCDFFTLTVRSTLNPAAVQAGVEGPYANGKPPPVVDPGVYPSHRQAEQLVGIVGIKNAQRAYFAGQTALIGKP